ncbi:MAG TPA: ATP synthase F0 subunit B [Candidatus Omnitrophota bacterium]|nr:ATP synthase F0 subunit B [Candidatus Omnitrophota bacterium]
MELLKLLSAKEIVAQIISFLVVFFVLKQLLWKRVLAALDERKEKIAGDFAMLEKAKKDANDLKLKYEALLGAIKEAAEVKLREKVLEGEEEAKAIIEKARQDSLRLLEDAKKEMRFELSKTRQELKDWLVETTLMVTEGILQEKLTSKGDRVLVEDLLKRAQESKDNL